jgi:hypothetical protein
MMTLCRMSLFPEPGHNIAVKLIPENGHHHPHLNIQDIKPPVVSEPGAASSRQTDLMYSKPLRKLGFSIDSIVGVKREAGSPPASRSGSPPTVRRRRSWSPDTSSPPRDGHGLERPRSRSPRWSVSPPPFTGNLYSI